jgi:hypothetical protein
LGLSRQQLIQHQTWPSRRKQIDCRKIAKKPKSTSECGRGNPTVVVAEKNDELKPTLGFESCSWHPLTGKAAWYKSACPGGWRPESTVELAELFNYGWWWWFFMGVAMCVLVVGDRKSTKTGHIIKMRKSCLGTNPIFIIWTHT